MPDPRIAVLQRSPHAPSLPPPFRRASVRDAPVEAVADGGHAGQAGQQHRETCMRARAGCDTCVCGGAWPGGGGCFRVCTVSDVRAQGTAPYMPCTVPSRDHPGLHVSAFGLRPLQPPLPQSPCRALPHPKPCTLSLAGRAAQTRTQARTLENKALLPLSPPAAPPPCMYTHSTLTHAHADVHSHGS